jgi:hypothetical protein
MVYRNGQYSVEVGPDGAIKVRPGDWLSKYSAAMFNTFWRVNEFGRMGRFGVEPIQNVNLINAGETIYHIPTYLKSKPSGTQSTRPPAPPMVDSAKKELIKGTLASDFNLRGERLAVLGKAIDIIGYADNALSLAEVAGLIAEGTVMSGVAAGTSIVSAILFPIGATIELMNDWEAGQRLAGMVAVAYTVTAWAFDDPIPGLPPRVQQNIKASGLGNEIPAYQQAWKDASGATLKSLAEMIAKKPGVSKQSFQVLFRAIGDDNRQALSKALIKGFEKNVNGVEKEILRTYDYPN